MKYSYKSHMSKSTIRAQVGSLSRGVWNILMIMTMK